MIKYDTETLKIIIGDDEYQAKQTNSELPEKHLEMFETIYKNLDEDERFVIDIFRIYYEQHPFAIYKAWLDSKFGLTDWVVFNLNYENISILFYNGTININSSHIYDEILVY